MRLIFDASILLVDHGRLFGEKATAQWEERNLITTGTSRKRSICILGKKKIKLAVSNFEPFIESQLDIPTSSLGYFCGRMYRAFLRGAEGNYF